MPALRIAVGRWGPSALADESAEMLLAAGANHVATLLIESRNFLSGLLELPEFASRTLTNDADSSVANLAATNRA
jgi:hypothetical protein